jgi:hypothetical protein
MSISKTVLIILLFFIATQVHAQAIARMPNNGGGYLVLTAEPCIHKGKDYAPLKRAYAYTAKGYTFEACYGIEDDTVVTVFKDGGDQRRFPVSNFELISRGSAI